MIVAKIHLNQTNESSKQKLSIVGIDSPTSVSDITEDEDIYILKEFKQGKDTFYILVTDSRIKVISEDVENVVFS
jgi:hypothetical protein